LILNKINIGKINTISADKVADVLKLRLQPLAVVLCQAPTGLQPKRCYIQPIYTVVSETLHAIALLGMTNSRLKDYLDLSVLLNREVLLMAYSILAASSRYLSMIAWMTPSR